MLSWRSCGLVGLLLPALCVALVVLLPGDIRHATSTGIFRGLLLLSCPVLWALGNRLNGDAGPGDEPRRCMGPALHKVPQPCQGLFVVYQTGKAIG